MQAPNSYFANTPLQLLSSEEQGRYLVAAKDIQEGEVVLVAYPYLTAILPSHKKRVCAACFKDMRRRLTFNCSGCSYCFYCSPECQQLHTVSGPCLSANNPRQDRNTELHTAGLQVPHAILCPIIKRFSSFKFDGDMAAILLMCLEALAIHQLLQQQVQQQQQQQQQQQTASEVGTAATDCKQHHGYQKGSEMGNGHTLGHEDFMLLTSGVQFSPLDKQDWIKGVRFLVTAMQKSGWPWALPAENQVMDMCSKILSNNFGMWSVKEWSVKQARDVPSSPSQQPAQESTGAVHEGRAQGMPADAITAAAAVTEREAGASSRAAGGPALPGAPNSSTGFPAPPAAPQEPRGQAADGEAVPPLHTCLQAHLGTNAASLVENLAHIDLTCGHGGEQAAGVSDAGQRAQGEPQTGTGASNCTDGTGWSAQAIAWGQNGCTIEDRWCCSQDVGGASFNAHAPAGVHHGCSGRMGGAAAQDITATEEGSAAAPAGVHHGCSDEVLGAASRSVVAPRQEGMAAAPAGAESSMRGKDELTGRQVYISASYFNHSCAPNLFVDHTGLLAVVRATEAIPAGTEANISYIDLDMPVGARRAELQRCFNFLCRCSRCLEELENGSAKVSWKNASATGKNERKGKEKGKPKKKH